MKPNEKHYCFGTSVKSIISRPIMANLGLVTAQALPRFLLPKLSWQSGSVGRQSLRKLSTVAATQTLTIHNYDGQRGTTSPRAVQFETSRFESSILRSIPRRNFHATASRSRDHHFDTLKFVQRLKEEGFTEEQSVAMMKVLSDVIEERYSYLCSHN